MPQTCFGCIICLESLFRFYYGSLYESSQFIGFEKIFIRSWNKRIFTRKRWVKVKKLWKFKRWIKPLFTKQDFNNLAGYLLSKKWGGGKIQLSSLWAWEIYVSFFIVPSQSLRFVIKRGRFVDLKEDSFIEQKRVLLQRIIKREIIGWRLMYKLWITEINWCGKLFMWGMLHGIRKGYEIIWSQ